MGHKTGSMPGGPNATIADIGSSRLRRRQAREDSRQRAGSLHPSMGTPYTRRDSDDAEPNPRVAKLAEIVQLPLLNAAVGNTGARQRHNPFWTTNRAAPRRRRSCYHYMAVLAILGLAAATAVFFARDGLGRPVEISTQPAAAVRRKEQDVPGGATGVTQGTTALHATAQPTGSGAPAATSRIPKMVAAPQIQQAMDSGAFPSKKSSGPALGSAQQVAVPVSPHFRVSIKGRCAVRVKLAGSWSEPTVSVEASNPRGHEDVCTVSLVGS